MTAKQIGREVWGDVRRAWTEAAGLARRHRLGLLLYALAAVAAAWLVFLRDAALLEWVSGDRQLFWFYFAGELTKYFDFLPAVVLPVVAIWSLGVWRRDPGWRALAAAVLLGTAVAGTGANILRASAGRARPHTEVPDGFYGPTLNGRYHSFCSSHAAALFSEAVTLAMTYPALSVPVLGVAGTVTWSRVYLRRHYPSDVVLGAALGIGCGFIFGLVARRRRHATCPRPPED